MVYLSPEAPDMNRDSYLARTTERHLGFSLVELLAAIAVLSLVLLMLSQVSLNTVQAITSSRNQMEATREARGVLDALQEDLSNLVTENGMATIFVKADGLNSQLIFVPRRRGSQGSTSSRFMAVSYALEGTRMVRKYSLIPWNEVDLMSSALQSLATGSESVVADGVLRFELVLLLDTGELVSLATTGSWKDTNWNGVALSDSYSALYLSGTTVNSSQAKVRALTVAVATMDGQSVRLPNAQNMSATLSSTAIGKTPLESWTSVINAGKLVPAPRPAASALRILQETYFLP